MGKTREERREFLELLMEGLSPEQREAELAEFERLEDEEERAPPRIKSRIEVWLEDHKHPFLGTQPTEHDKGAVFHMKTKSPDDLDSNAMQLAFVIEKIDVEGGPFYETMEELEQAFLSKLPKYELEEPNSTSELWKTAMFEIERAGSRIARNTRRGKANVLVMSNNDPFFVWPGLIGENEMLNGRYRVVRRSYVPDNVVYILYSGFNAFDQGGIYAPHVDFDGDMSVKNRLVTVPETTMYGFKMDFSDFGRTSNDN